MQPGIVPKLVAEFVGTFALILIGAGAGALGIGGLVGVALAHGFVIVAVAYAFGLISGAHLNPAVTTGLMVTGDIDPMTGGAYIVTQIVAAVVACLVLAFALGGTATGLGATTLAQGLIVGDPAAPTATITVTPLAGVVVEAVMTFFLVNTVLNTAVAGRGGDLAPVAIGLTLTFCILMAGPLTGGSLNPARTLGPAIVTGNFADLWVYIVGPVLGAVAAAGLYKGVLKHGAIAPIPAGKVSTRVPEVN